MCSCVCSSECPIHDNGYIVNGERERERERVNYHWAVVLTRRRATVGTHIAATGIDTHSTDTAGGRALSYCEVGGW